jgi:hypothetical protein
MFVASFVSTYVEPRNQTRENDSICQCYLCVPQRLQGPRLAVDGAAALTDEDLLRDAKLRFHSDRSQ